MVDIFKLFRFVRNRQAARACATKDPEGLARALTGGADPNAIARRCERSYRGKYEHLIHRVVKLQWHEGLAILLEHGANMELRGGIDNATAFFQACEQQQEPIMKMLAQHGADPDGMGWSIDHEAVDKIMDVVGWDYPSQSSLITVREMKASELVAYRRNPEQLAILAMAQERHAAITCRQTLEHATQPAHGRPRAARL